LPNGPGQPVCFAAQRRPVLANGPGQPVCFAVHRRPVLASGPDQPVCFAAHRKPVLANGPGQPVCFTVHRRPVLANGHGQPVCFAAHRRPVCWTFFYHSRILSIGGSVWYLVRNLHCSVTVDSVLANSKTQNTFLSPVVTMFCHDCPPVVKPASTP
jgi:hypothetical protein